LIAGFLAVGTMSWGQSGIDPPPMPVRSIAPRSSRSGHSEEIEEGGQKFKLFVPGRAKARHEVNLTLHFHSATWHAIQEHEDRGIDGPLIAFYPGEGSAIYGRSFQDPLRLSKWIQIVLERLIERGWPRDCQVQTLSITSFSAGYGAVRQIVQQPEHFQRLRRVILADSLYGSLTPNEDPTVRIPLAEHVAVWKPLAQAAIRGEKTFAITCSEVPTPSYASSSEVARAIVESIGGRLDPAETSHAAAKDPQHPLRMRFDKGRFHVWQYGGNDGPAHMTHARHLADIWKALDRAGAP
jgi:hypothetical protein